MKITEETFLDYCQQNYRNQHCISIDEFLEDLKILKYIKVLLRKHISQKDINALLLLNHFIAFYNVFEKEAASQIILFKLEDYYWPAARAILDYMNTTPSTFISSEQKLIYMEDVEVCEHLQQKLKNIKSTYV